MLLGLRYTLPLSSMSTLVDSIWKRGISGVAMVKKQSHTAYSGQPRYPWAWKFHRHKFRA